MLKPGLESENEQECSNKRARSSNNRMSAENPIQLLSLGIVRRIHLNAQNSYRVKVFVLH